MATSLPEGATASSATNNLYLARQPILDRDQTLVAFELLFRSSAATSAHVVYARGATADVILNAFFELGV